MINARENLLNTTNKLLTAGLNHGASGNCSCRDRGGFLITPTGIDSAKLTTDMMVRMNLSDDLPQPESKYQPSSEWQFHQAILENIQKLMQSFTRILFLQAPLVFWGKTFLHFTI